MKVIAIAAAVVGALVMLAACGGGTGEPLQPVVTYDFQKGLEAYERGDYATALREFKALAEQGDASAQFNLGVMYKKGRGVTQDYAQAVKWYRLAAEQRDAVAQTILGFMYEKGQGVTQDYAQAVKWYRLAAEQGYAAAQNSLGLSYTTGKGVTRDYVQAHMWFNLATVQGHKNSAKGRDLVEKRMTTADISKAQRMARQWRPGQ